MARPDAAARTGAPRPSRRSAAAPVLMAAALGAAMPAASADDRANGFDDPFVQVTAAIADCPVPPRPPITQAEMRAQAHARAERGTRCFESGRCRLPNAYLYDKEIIPRVQKAILAAGGYADTSIWLEGQRRWVTLKGCVRSAAQAAALASLARGIDDVEAVIDELVVRPR